MLPVLCCVAAMLATYYGSPLPSFPLARSPALVRRALRLATPPSAAENGRTPRSPLSSPLRGASSSRPRRHSLRARGRGNDGRRAEGVDDDGVEGRRRSLSIPYGFSMRGEADLKEKTGTIASGKG